MKIIVLKGRASSGKTTAIKELVNLLLKNGGQFICKNDDDKFHKHYDFTVPFIYREVLIAITSMGDDLNSIKGPFENYNNYAKILICAAHDNDKFEGHFADLEKDGHEIIFIDIFWHKITSEEQIKKKCEDAIKKLFDTLNEVISKL